MDREFELRVGRIFERVQGLTPAMRTARLEALSGGDDRLRDAVNERVRRADAPTRAWEAEPPAEGDWPTGPTRIAGLPRGSRVGDYLVGKRVGTGGMGDVYRAELLRARSGFESGDVVALKILHAHLRAAPGFRERFRREAEIGQRVDHPNVVRTFDAGDAVLDGQGVDYLAMEFVEGRTLDDLRRDVGVVPEELCVYLGREVAKALAAIHAVSAVHRDLKPSNVVLTPDHVVKLMDLGVALDLDESLRLSRTGQFVGTILYAAPEQLTPDAPVDGRADLYALGLLLYELSSGQHPFEAGSVRTVLGRQLQAQARPLGEFNPAVSAFFEEVVRTLIEKDPDRRLANASALAEVLRRGEASPWWAERARAIRAATHSSLRRARVAPETELFGRDAELARLGARFADAQAGAGSAVLIEGEAGIGKSRLLDELIASLDGGSLHVVDGGYPPGGAATGAGAFASALLAHFGDDDELEGHLREALPMTPSLVPAFAAFLRGRPAPDDAAPLAAEALRTLFVHAVRAIAADRPTVVLIEDLHFAPEEGRTLFAALASAVREHRVVLIGTARRGLPERWVTELERGGTLARIELERLGPEAVESLVGDILRSRPLARALAPTIARQSDGNPFFVVEIVQGLRDSGQLQPGGDGSLAAASSIDRIEIPSSVRDVIHSRLNELDDDDRTILDVAACCGYAFDPLLVGEALGLEPLPLLQRLARIESRHRLVHSVGRRFRFDHHQVQETLESALPAPLRERYHATIGTTLERREGLTEPGAERASGDLAASLTRHFLAAADPEGARRYFDRALAHLAESFRHEVALDLTARALSLAGFLEGETRFDVLLDRASRLALLGRREEERALIEAAEVIADERDDDRLRLRTRTAAGARLLEIGELEQAEEVLSDTVSRAEGLEDRRASALAIGQLGEIRAARGEFDAAREMYARQLELAEELDDATLRGTAEGRLGNAFLFQARYEEAREHFENHLRIARETGDVLSELRATGNIGNVFLALGRFDSALACTESVRRRAREVAARRLETIATGVSAVVLVSLGRLGEAAERLRARLDLSREIGDRLGVGIALGNLGHVEAWLGDAEEGARLLDEALGVVRAMGVRRSEAHTIQGLGSIEEQRGNLDAAVARHEEALAIFEQIGTPSGIAQAHGVLGRILREQGETERATDHLDRALELARETNERSVLVLARVYRALVDPTGRTEAAAALAAHESGVGAIDRLRARWSLWRATGDRGHLDAARKLVDQLVASAPEERRRVMRRGVPLFREILAAS